MASSSEIMLEEMRHAYDTMYLSVAKYESKTIAVFGAELAMLLFYIANDEIQSIKNLFVMDDNGWCVFAIIAALAFLVAAVLFIATLTIDRHWLMPPDSAKTLYKNKYNKMAPDELRNELIEEYHESIKFCSKKIHAMKVLSDIGIYFMAGGVICLLLIKLFGV